jgi:hypothetical protein
MEVSLAQDVSESPSQLGSAAAAFIFLGGSVGWAPLYSYGFPFPYELVE